MNAIEELREEIDGSKLMNLVKLNNFLDHIEQEYIELPKDKNGKHIQIGSFVGHGDGKEKKVLYIQIHRGGRTCVATTDFTGFSSLVKLIEHDSQEKIDEDARVNSYDYCNKRGLDLTNYTVASKRDLLRCQRELCAKGGE